MGGVVSRATFGATLQVLLEPDRRALDCEATGLQPYLGDQLFALIISSGGRTDYFNFHAYPGLDPEWVLPREWLRELRPIFSEPKSSWYLHNAKYDLALLHKEGLEIEGEVHCTEAIARIEQNDHLKYSLDACVERIGHRKSDAVERYILEHGLWEWETTPGKKTRTKKKFFDQVPYDIIVPYGLKDAQITYVLGEHQRQALCALDASFSVKRPSILDVFEIEKQFTKTCFSLEKAGVRIDPDFCTQAIEYETARHQKAAEAFEKISQFPFRDARSVLTKAFYACGEKYPLTDKGNPSFTDEVLATFTSPLAALVREYRAAYKNANTYYRNFLELRDAYHRIHMNLRQSGTKTGRISCAEPNLQNLPKAEDEDLSQPYLVRRAFVPEPGTCLFMLDYDQVEYKLLLDRCAFFTGETALLEQIKGGMDVHVATAQLLGCSRKQAKAINFGLLYGQGAALLAQNLGVSVQDARQIKHRYFEALPGVQKFIKSVSDTAQFRGFVFNWTGRRWHCPDPTFSYKAPNAVIQGGVGDIVKIAMNEVAAFLKDKKTRMLLQIHDEIWLESPPSEFHLIPEIRSILEKAYPYKYLPMTCSVSHSFKSAADKVKGFPT